MDKLSIYELLSFIIPGYIAAKILEYYFTLFRLDFPFPIADKLDDNLLLVVVAIILGVAVHVLTFKIIGSKRLSWLKSWIYKPEAEYIKNSKSGELQLIMPAVNKFYREDSKQPAGNQDSYDKWTFDYAYYYLEVNDKITQAKNFQSFYFLFRNLFMISMIHFALLAVLCIASPFIDPKYSILNAQTAMMGVLLLPLTWILVVITNWLRGKMIDRVFWSYYVDRRTKEIDNKK